MDISTTSNQATLILTTSVDQSDAEIVINAIVAPSAAATVEGGGVTGGASTPSSTSESSTSESSTSESSGDASVLAPIIGSVASRIVAVGVMVAVIRIRASRSQQHGSMTNNPMKHRPSIVMSPGAMHDLQSKAGAQSQASFTPPPAFAEPPARVSYPAQHVGQPYPQGGMQV